MSQLAKPVFLISFFVGLILSWAVFSGDQFGRVNLLYLLLLYVVLPCVSLVISLVSFFYSPLQSFSFSSLITSTIQNNHFVFSNYKKYVLKLPQSESPKLTLFYLSQIGAVGFSLAGIIILFVLLLATDVHFIWRSTILNTEHILEVLKIIAIPWRFWPEAQPSFDLIAISQDNRLFAELNNQQILVNANWWKFVFATQLFYAFLLRYLVILVLKFIFNYRSQQKENNIRINESTSVDVKFNNKRKKIEVENNVTSSFAINNWANFDSSLIELIESKMTGNCINKLNAGPEGTETEKLIAERWRDTQIILVKSWEPPLAELSDYMQNSTGYLLPLDIKSKLIVANRQVHLYEWYRFLETLPQWKLLRINSLDDNVLS